MKTWATVGKFVFAILVVISLVKITTVNCEQAHEIQILIRVQEVQQATIKVLIQNQKLLNSERSSEL